MVAMEEPQFNLLDECWIPVLRVDGRNVEVSLKDLFVYSYKIRRIDTGDPLQDTAILGVALAVFARAAFLSEGVKTFGGVAPWIRQMRESDTGNLVAVLGYLEYFRNRFWLAGSDRPFMQVSELGPRGGGISKVKLTDLFLESRVSTTKRPQFTMVADDALKTLTYAEAARRLITLQAYDIYVPRGAAAGDPREKAGKVYGVSTGWYGTTGKVIVHGANLMETLLYNLDYGQLTGESFEHDLPVWERTEPDTAAPRAYTGGPASQYKDVAIPAKGMCEILTWQSRRIRLQHDGYRIVGVFIANGDKWYNKDTYVDHLTGYRRNKKQEWVPRLHTAEHSLWYGASSLLTWLNPESDEQNKPAPVIRQLGLGRYFPADTVVNVQLVGVQYGDVYGSFVSQVISESVPMELSLLTVEGASVSQMVCENIKATMDVADALGQFAGNLLKAAGKEYKFCSDATEALLHRMEDSFRQWVVLQHSSEDIVLQKKEWQTTVRLSAIQETELLINSAGPKAMMGTFVKDRLGNESFYSAATARRQLESRLRKIIPLAYRDSISHSDKEETNE